MLDPDLYYRLARATYAEMALAGIAAVGEFHYLHHAPGGMPYADPHAMAEAVIAAAWEVGLRICLLDTCYLRGRLRRATELRPRAAAVRPPGRRDAGPGGSPSWRPATPAIPPS